HARTAPGSERPADREDTAREFDRDRRVRPVRGADRNPADREWGEIMTLAADDWFVARAAARAAVRAPIRAAVTPGETTVPLDQYRKPGRTRAVLPGQLGVRPAPITLRQSIIVPTYNERDNVPALLDRLAAALPHADTEIIFVDDSSDGTP